MATLVASYPVSSGTASAATALVTPSFTPAAGEIIVVKSLTNNPVTATPSGGGLTYTVRASSNDASNVSVAIHTAVVGASPSAMTVSVAWSGAERRSIVVERWSSASLVATPATNTTKTGVDTAPSATVTTTAANSVVTWVDGDWNESTGTVTYRSGATQELQHLATSSFSGWYAYQTAAAAGAQTIGMTAPPSQKWSMVGIEILDASSVAKSGSDSGTGSETGSVTAAPAGADSGTGSESGFAALRQDGADSGTGSESGYIAVPRSGSDSASGSETGTVNAAATSGDTGAGGSSGSMTASVPGGDSGTGSQSGFIRIPGSDAGTGGSSLKSLTANITRTDTGSGSEGGYVETLYGDLSISLWAIHPTTGALVPLPDFTKLTLSPQRNSAGSISLEYPTTGLNFDFLRSVITSDRDLEVEIWNLGSPTGALRGYLQEAAGDDVSEDGLWQFAGGFLELRMSEAVVFPQPLIGVPSLGPEVTVVHGTISQAKWDQLLALGYTGRAGDEQEALYVPQLVLDAVNNGTTVPVLADPKRELKFSAVSPGELVGFIMAQARARGTLTDIEWDFTAAKDSGGTTWPNVLSTKFSPGAGYDQILDKLVDLGLAEWAVTWTGSQKKLQMWVPQGRGVDRTLGNRPVVLRKGRNLLEAPRKWSVRDSGTAMLAAGSEGVYESTSSADAQTRRGRRIELSASANNLAVSSAVQAFAQSQLAVSSTGLLEVTHGIGFLPGEPRPLIAFDVGDWVYSQTGTSMDRLRVVQWTLTVDAKQNPSGTVTLNDTVQDSLVRLQRRLNALTSGETVVGTSEASQPEDMGVPQAPTGVIVGSTAYLVDGVAHSSVSASWDTVILNTDGTAATDLQGYKVESKYDAGGDWAGVADVGPNSNTASFDASPGVQLKVRVAAYDRNGNVSAWSVEASHTTEDDTTPPPVPSTPVVSNYLGVLKIAWDGNSSTGTEMKAAAPDFEWCEVHLSTGSLFTPSTATLVGLMYAKGEWVVADLDYGVTYYARLIAVDTRSNASAPSAQGSAVPGKVVSDDVFAGAIGSAQLANLAVKTANIDNAAVNDLQVGNMSVGKLTAGTFSAAMTLSGSIRTATAGARSEIDGAGIRLYNTAGTLTVRLQTSDGSALVTGTYQSGLTGERINTLPDGTMRFYGATGTNYSEFANMYGQVAWRGVLDANGRSGRFTVGAEGASMHFASVAEAAPPFNMRSEIALFDRYAKVIAPLVELKVDGRRTSPDGFERRVLIKQSDAAGNDIGGSTMHWVYVTAGSGPAWLAVQRDSGIKFGNTSGNNTIGNGRVYITDAAGGAFRSLQCSILLQDSSEKGKADVAPITATLAQERALDVVRAVRAKSWLRRPSPGEPPPADARPEFGLIAEELRDVAPDLVDGATTPDGKLAIAPMAVAAMAWEGVKENDEEITAVSAKLDALIATLGRLPAFRGLT